MQPGHVIDKMFKKAGCQDVIGSSVQRALLDVSYI